MAATVPDGCGVATQRVALTSHDVRWGKPTQYAWLDGGNLVVNVPHGETPSSIVGISGVVPMRKIGPAQAVKATIRARGTGIAKPAVKYHGLKFQFRVFDHMTGMARYPNTATVKHGTFPWRTLDVLPSWGDWKATAMFRCTWDCKARPGKLNSICRHSSWSQLRIFSRNRKPHARLCIRQMSPTCRSYGA